MADYVLVHGGNMTTDTWNRLARRNDYPPGGHLGNKYWDGTTAFLTQYNHCVFAPELRDENISSLTEHIEQVCMLITGNALNEVILVGHSYGGMVITGVAVELREKLRQLIYIDAAVPVSGESLYDILNLGLSISSSRRPELPAPSPPYVEKIHFDPSRIETLPKTYILCTKSEFGDVTRIAKQRIVAAKQGWTYLELPASHVPMADMPDKLYQLLLDTAA
ncbi:MAG: Alpha/beta hydrolase family protein [Smithella sp. PtaU1.Bin162]|nr:MAG: Alpha/beta hydrolase family protein [Smithella sp. PtaU1.Bin162]